jgi:diguanylate cyclase (GGDEF)-like protein
MLDLDLFKSFNDDHGHQAGDRLLKEAAAAWRAQLRATDMLARYGGEEFVVLLQGPDVEAARRVVDRLRVVTPRGQSCSAGIARREAGEDAAALLARADAALYEAKRAGRNRSAIAGSGVSAEA